MWYLILVQSVTSSTHDISPRYDLLSYSNLISHPGVISHHIPMRYLILVLRLNLISTLITHPNLICHLILKGYPFPVWSVISSRCDISHPGVICHLTPTLISHARLLVWSLSWCDNSWRCDLLPHPNLDGKGYRVDSMRRQYANYGSRCKYAYIEAQI